MDNAETQDTFVATKMDDTCALCCRQGTGRSHGPRFLCVDCESTQRLVRRNMGSLPPMSEEDKHAFFSKAAATKDARANWKLVRAALKEVCLRRKTRVHGIEVKAPYKPLKFWTEQGYTEEAVRACPSTNGPMGELFQVATTSAITKDFEEEIEEEILMRESAAAKKKKDENAKEPRAQAEAWHLPDSLPSASAKPTGRAKASAKAAARTEASAAKQKEKLEKKNAALSGTAGKSLGLLQPKLRQLKTCATQLEKQDDPGLQELKNGVKEALEKVTLWVHKSGEVVAAFQMCPTADLQDLPYDQGSLKTCVQAVTSLLRSARDALRAAKPEAEGAKTLKRAMPKSAAAPSSRKRQKTPA